MNILSCHLIKAIGKENTLQCLIMINNATICINNEIIINFIYKVPNDVLKMKLKSSDSYANVELYPSYIIECLNLLKIFFLFANMKLKMDD